MAGHLLDTTVLIDILRGRPAGERVLAMRSAGEVPCTCAINVEELVRGLRPKEARAARALIESLHVVPLGREEGARAGDWRRTFASRGRTLSQADCLIAAAAMTAGARLATGNPKDFPMREVEVIHWPSGG